METRERVGVTCAAGVEGDPRGEPGPRQVSVVSQNLWSEACRTLGVDLPWTLRRANLLIEGVPLEMPIGRRLHVGSVVLEITDESTPCEEMDKQHPGLREVLEGACRGGVVCRVINGGEIAVGDTVDLGPPDQ
ncbi:MAG: MOSC domain-containing protein [Planctomycetota bacterium]|jgi:MOSC domain-containing protein YiiM